jgi:hypothetical protein
MFTHTINNIDENNPVTQRLSQPGVYNVHGLTSHHVFFFLGGRILGVSRRRESAFEGFKPDKTPHSDDWIQGRYTLPFRVDRSHEYPHPHCGTRGGHRRCVVDGSHQLRTMWKMFPAGHFDIFKGNADWEKALAAQLAFLGKHVPV